MKKILFLTICFIFSFNIYSIAKYKIEYEFYCFDFKIDNVPPNFEVTYSNIEWTNDSVVIFVKPSEKIQGIEGFELKDGYYIKKVEANESKSVKVKDLSGNEGILEYSVSNIDKIPPIIKGINNNEKYDRKLSVEYIDNESGINSVNKEYYGDLLIESKKDYYDTADKFGIDVSNDSITIRVIRAPKNIVKYKYFRIDNDDENFVESKEKCIKFSNTNKKCYKYYVIAEDDKGKTYKSNIIERSSGYFETISVNKNKENAEITIDGLYKEIDKVNYSIMNLNNELLDSGVIKNKKLCFNINNFNKQTKYKIKIDFLSKEKRLDTRYLYINMNEVLIKEADNTFSLPGLYDITVTDNAGNSNVYTISIDF